MFSSPSTVNTSAAGDVVKDVTITTFKADVLDASRTVLVLACFWAPWDAPCKQLVATLEKITRASKGGVKLVKIDVDRQQPLAVQMGVQSVPAVFAFYQGRPIDAFAGTLPEEQIKVWLDQLMQATGAAPASEKVGLESALKQAMDFLSAKDITAAQAIYADILDMEPTNPLAYAGLVRCLIDGGDVVKARHMLDTAPASIAKDKACDAVRAAIELAEQAHQGNGQITDLEAKVAQNPIDHQARFDLALALYAAQRREEAVDQLLEIVQRARTWNEDGARKQLVKFFEAFGATDPLTISARKRLSSLLFS